MNTYNSPAHVPVAKRTRLQTQLHAQGFSGISPGVCGSASNRSRKRKSGTRCTQNGVKQEDHEVIDVDDYGIKNRAFEKSTQKESDDEIKGYGSANPFKTGPHLYFVYSDESDVEEDDEDLQTSCKFNQGSENNTAAGALQSSEDDEDEQVRSSESEKDEFDFRLLMSNKRPDNSTINLSFAETVSSLDNSDSDDGCVILEEQDFDVDLHMSCKYDNGSQKDTEASSMQSTEDDEDEPISSSESESDDLDDADFSLARKRLHQRAHNVKEKVWCESAARKEKNPSLHQTNMIIKRDKKQMDESSHTDDNEKQNVKDNVKGHHMTVDKANPVKNERSRKGEQYIKSKGGRRDEGGCIDALLDSIVSNEEADSINEDDRLPLKFRFDDSEDESSQKTDESNGEVLFQEMEFALQCDEIGSYRIPKVEENSETDDYYDDIDPCKRGVHGDVVYEEQTGLRCCLCGAVLLESRYVIPKLANYAPDKSKRRYHFDEQQFSSHENPFLMDLDSNPYDICKQTKGTVWELIPARIQAHMYPHQQEGFEFLWKNLAGSIELSKLQNLSPRGGGGVGAGGCIISHAPGTGKTFLTIVFIESFIKRFPKCRPVIVAPASMLLTWEAEFKKWQVGFSFINLHNTDPLSKEVINGGSRHNKDSIRAIKIHSWITGGIVLGVSYNLYEKLAGDSYKRNTRGEKIRTCLLDKPGLVVLDEGHTPRNQNSKIWNTLVKLETKNRVILSGTPFQNNFRELFNTLRIVRPKTANSIGKEKFFADMIQKKNMKKSRGRSSTEDIKKLKEIISPFVHVHKGHILQSKLPGLKQSVILLNPPAFQKSFIENLGNSASTFEYEHKVALVSVHPSLVLHCSLSEKEKKSINKQELEDVRLHPEVGVKTRFVMELIRLSLSLNEKVLIFSQYIQPSELLQDQIIRTFGWDVEKEITHIKGKIHQTRRQKIINAFNDPKSELKVLLASTKCCSEGIHLYGASRVVLLDVVWNPSVERQAISRAYRIGQKKVVYTYHLMAAGTSEEEKYDRQVEKWRLAEMVFSSGSNAGGEPKNKVIVGDEILQQMVDHKELKDMFKKIRYPEYQTRI